MEVFSISSASTKPIWVLTVVCLLLALILAALAYTAYSSRNSVVEMDRVGIKLVGDFWGRAIPFEQLNIEDAKVLNLNVDREFIPKKRTFGTGLPGYSSGWFRLSNGEKALIYLSQRQKVVYVPTLKGYSLLLSIDEAERFVAELKKHRGW